MKGKEDRTGAVALGKDLMPNKVKGGEGQSMPATQVFKSSFYIAAWLTLVRGDLSTMLNNPEALLPSFFCTQSNHFYPMLFVRFEEPGPCLAICENRRHFACIKRSSTKSRLKAATAAPPPPPPPPGATADQSQRQPQWLREASAECLEHIKGCTGQAALVESSAELGYQHARMHARRFSRPMPSVTSHMRRKHPL